MKRPSSIRESPFTAPAADYAHNILIGTSLRRLERSFLHRIEDIDLVRDMAREGMKDGGTSLEDEHGDVAQKELLSCLRRFLAKHGARPRVPRSPSRPVMENLNLVARLVGLEESERAVFQFLLSLRDSRDLKDLVDVFGPLPLSAAAGIIAAATATPRDGVIRTLGQGGRLISSGLVAVQRGFHDVAEKVGIKCGVFDAILEQGLDEARLLARFLPEAAPTTLNWSDFSHLREQALTARDILAGAIGKRRCGVNLLFYGESGTGKTELSRLIAQDIGGRLYVAGQADDDGESATARERLSSVLLGQRLIRSGNALVLFDELEDLFRSGFREADVEPWRSGGAMSKQWFNDLLEKNQVPTIWITNSTNRVDPAFLRRFLYAVEFRPLGPAQRARVLARHLGEESAVTPAEAAAIADRYTVSPALFGSAVAAARLTSPEGKPDRASIERVLAPMEKLVTGIDSSRLPIFETTSFRLDGLNSPADLKGIVEQLSEWKPGPRAGISLCLYGPPGTGKSEYVKYVAHRMGRPVVLRRVSDIASCWVGQTEKNIARAFQEAEDNDSVLLFDEADSFLRDRGKAMHSWEVTEVNEFLQQLESFRGILACTTNLWRDLDEASLRRFVFKIEFRYLGPDQAMSLFRSMFGPELATPLDFRDELQVRTALSRLGNLAPGDFAAVVRQVRTGNRRSSPSELVTLLEAEVRAKPGAGRAVGFQEDG